MAPHNSPRGLLALALVCVLAACSDSSDRRPGGGEPTEPPEPVVSANATGNAPTEDPMPKATASTPTRPT